MKRFICKAISVALATTASLLGGCTILPPKDPYAIFRELMPRSILVLPPINESVDVNATYSWLTTASRPIAEKGFYVFPVAIVDEFMKENGLPNPEDMHVTPLNKLGEVFGADAVMYVTIEDYGQKFGLLQSTTTVVARAELVDVKTGQSFWMNRVAYYESSDRSDNSILGWLGALITSAVTQISKTISDAAHDASRLANAQLLDEEGSGLLLGPLHPGFDEQMAAAAEKAAAAEAQAADLPAADD